MNKPATDLLGDALPSGALQRLGTRRMQGPVVDMAYSADGEHALVVTGSSLAVWNLPLGELLNTYTLSDVPLTAMASTVGVDRMTVVDQSGWLIDWDLQEHKEIRRIDTGRGNGIATLQYSPDESRLLSVDRQNSIVEEWDISTGKRLQEITKPGGSFNRAIYGSDGKTVFLGHQEGNNVYHYDLVSGEPLQIFVEDYCNYDMCLSQDGERLFVGTRHKANEWRLSDYTCIQTYTGHLGHAVPSVAYTRDEDHLLTGSRDGSIRLWNRHSAEVVRKWYPHQRHVKGMRVSPDGKWVLSYGGDQLLAETSLETGEGRLNWNRHRAGIHSLAFTEDGRHAVSGSADKTIRIWHSAEWESVGQTVELDTEVYALSVLDEEYFAAGCKDGSVRIISLNSGETVKSFDAHRGYVRAVRRLSKERILSAGGGGSLKVWVWEQEKLIREMTRHLGGVLALDVSADSTRAVSGGRDGSVHVWDLETGDALAKIDAHRGWVEAVAFGEGNEQVFSAGRDGVVVEWDLDAGEEVRVFDHSEWIEALAIDHDRVYSAGRDGRIVVWDRNTGSPEKELTGHEGTIHSLVLDPDGKTIISGSEDTTLLVWSAE